MGIWYGAWMDYPPVVMPQWEVRPDPPRPTPYEGICSLYRTHAFGAELFKHEEAVGGYWHLRQRGGESTGCNCGHWFAWRAT